MRVSFNEMTHIDQRPTSQGAAAVAYRRLAPYYDRFTVEHDYERWTTSLEPLARRHGLAGKRLLDVACGTGKSFEPFVRRGYAVTACDLSPEMTAQAAVRAGGAAEVHVADMRALACLGSFDLVTCLGDSLNYLTGAPGDLAAAFASAARNLRPGGLYLFDVNTLFTYRSWFLADHCVDAGELYFAWRGARPEPVDAATVAVATVEIFSPAEGGLWARDVSRHVQRHHPEPLLRSLLADGGFDAVWAYGQDRTGTVAGAPDEDRLTKTIFVARRTGGPSDPGKEVKSC